GVARVWADAGRGGRAPRPPTAWAADGRAVSTPAVASPAPRPSPMNARRPSFSWDDPVLPILSRPSMALILLWRAVPRALSHHRDVQCLQARQHLARCHNLGIDLVHRAHRRLLHVV